MNWKQRNNLKITSNKKGRTILKMTILPDIVLVDPMLSSLLVYNLQYVAIAATPTTYIQDKSNKLT